jgi:hypothetical protein
MLPTEQSASAVNITSETKLSGSRPANAVLTPRPRDHAAPIAYHGEPQLNVLSIWGPFAGFGSRRRHLGWLLDGNGSRVEELTTKVENNFSKRQIPSTDLRQETLIARGLIVESRPYFILKRGLISVALYINKFGKDLYVSIVSYLKPPISNLRVLVLGVMLAFWAYFSFVFPSILNNQLNSLLGSFGLFNNASPDTGGLFTLLCILGPLGTVNDLALLLFMFYSIYKWLTERDLWAGLRVNPNEFNEDDLMAMEKAVEQTVRISLDEIGLNPDDLKPVSSSENRRII